MSIFQLPQDTFSSKPAVATLDPITIGSPTPVSMVQSSRVPLSPLSPSPSVVHEKQFHFKYLTEFRADQCPLFLQHKCSQHRPFTCFYWHFQNQRRRRPIRRKDGHFSHSADTYCTLYDENTGLCPQGDDCPFLHRTAGDTERRYHLRYYKTSTCVHETDARGYCVKNGVHCAFAHGTHDMRQPVCDIREIQNLDEDESGAGLFGSLEREKGYLTDDPRWQNSSFVLTYYKTEPCPKPPKLCRQGYACPFFHNNKDKRRTPKTNKYRSTPCPNVKVNDEWGDPRHCESSDQCLYCHTRTEQQFHVEIYKSTKCNDVQQTGYCPRGAFCAFAHNESELNAQRELTSAPLSSSTPHELPSSREGTEEFVPHRTLIASSQPKPIGNKSSLLGIAYSAGALGRQEQKQEFGEDELTFGISPLVSTGLSGSVASSVSDTADGLGANPSVDDINSLEFDMSDLEGFAVSDAHLTDSKVSTSILATSPAAQKFLQTFSHLSQVPLMVSDPLSSPYISSSAPTHPYDVIKRQHTSPLRVPNQPIKLQTTGHESLTQAMQGMSVGDQNPASLGTADQTEGEEVGQSDSLAMGVIPDRHMESNNRLSELHHTFPPLLGGTEGSVSVVTPFIHLNEPSLHQSTGSGADLLSTSAPTHATKPPRPDQLIDSLLKEQFPRAPNNQLISAGGLMSSPGAHSLNCIENEILQERLKHAHGRINQLEGNCLQYQQSLEFMKRRMEMMEMSLASKHTDTSEVAVQGFNSDLDPSHQLMAAWRQDTVPLDTCAYCGHKSGDLAGNECAYCKNNQAI